MLLILEELALMLLVARVAGEITGGPIVCYLLD
jgi:hypothetical protein